MNVEGVLTLDNVDLQGRTVLFRVDVNSPIEPSSGELLDDGRLRAIVPTLNRIQSSRVVLLAHQSRPGKADFTSMRKHSERLSEIIGRSIDFIPDVCSDKAINEIEKMRDGDIVFLDNV